jgi:hypothetical protein
MALLAAAVFGTDAEAAVRVYRPTEPSQVPPASVSVACMAAVWVGSRLAG